MLLLLIQVFNEKVVHKNILLVKIVSYLPDSRGMLVTTNVNDKYKEQSKAGGMFSKCDKITYLKGSEGKRC